MRLRPRVFMLRLVAILPLMTVTGCWLMVGVEDPAPSGVDPFVETVTSKCQMCVTKNCPDALVACAETEACVRWPVNPVGQMPKEAEALKQCMRGACFAPCYEPFTESVDKLTRDQVPSP